VAAASADGVVGKPRNTESGISPKNQLRIANVKLRMTANRKLATRQRITRRSSLSSSSFFPFCGFYTKAKELMELKTIPFGAFCAFRGSIFL